MRRRNFLGLAAAAAALPILGANAKNTSYFFGPWLPKRDQFFDKQGVVYVHQRGWDAVTPEDLDPETLVRVVEEWAPDRIRYAVELLEQRIVDLETARDVGGLDGAGFAINAMDDHSSGFVPSVWNAHVLEATRSRLSITQWNDAGQLNAYGADRRRLASLPMHARS